MGQLLQRHRALSYILVLMAGLFMGWLAFRPAAHTHADGADAEGAETDYTCSMHPQIHQPDKGLCPLCGMDLIPAANAAAAAGNYDENAVMLSDEALALANVQTEVVGGATAKREVRLFGKVLADQRLEQTQAAYVAGRIEKLHISATGDDVTKGQLLATIYSPELYTAQKELLTTLSLPESQRTTLQAAATEKLRLLNVPEADIERVLKTRQASPYAELRANTSGTVLAKNIQQGDYVSKGQPLFSIANLSRVWATFQAYEADLAVLKVGQTVNFTTEALPGRTFSGRISFIDPVIDAQSRTAAVRVEMPNPGGVFKAQMLLVGNVAASMHKDYADALSVPKSAVLWTGKRSVVYVKDDTDDLPVFMLREVTLGPAVGDSYIITDGLAEGEEVVTNGAFTIDAAAQLDGKKSAF